MHNQIDNPLGQNYGKSRWLSIIGMTIIILGIGFIINCLRSDPASLLSSNVLFTLYILIAGGVRVYISSDDDKIHIWKKFVGNFIAFWLIRIPICYLEIFIFGTPIFWIANIVFVLFVELGFTNKLIVYIENKLKSKSKAK